VSFEVASWPAMEAKERGKMAINLDIGIDGSGPIGKAIVDTFSPVSNLLGLIGDQVRVYRELTLRRTLQRARDIADDEGLPLTEPPVGFWPECLRLARRLQNSP
jgi:hypothetical protein